MDIFWQVFWNWPSDSAAIGPMFFVPFAAVVYLAAARWKLLRRFRFRRILRLMYARKYWSHRSHRLDIVLMFGNIGLLAAIIHQFLISLRAVSRVVHTGLDATFGVHAATTLDPTLVACIWGVALFLAYEFSYWFDHYLSHRITFLWEFHKVHHTAETLSPLTNFRVHPVDSIVFVNIIALVNGTMTGVLHHVFGAGPVDLGLVNVTTVIAFAAAVFSQLQHTHVWIPTTDWLGRILLSPAHHQIHHSVEQRHHNKNLGNLFGVYDWMFGTLFVPSKRRPKLRFGVDDPGRDAHSIVDALVEPFMIVAGQRKDEAATAAHVQPQKT